MLQSTGSRGGNRIEQLKREDAPNHETDHERLLNTVMFMQNVLVSSAMHVNLNMFKFREVTTTHFLSHSYENILVCLVFHYLQHESN